jgi:hypothetical protein
LELKEIGERLGVRFENLDEHGVGGGAHWALRSTLAPRRERAQGAYSQVRAWAPRALDTPVGACLKYRIGREVPPPEGRRGCAGLAPEEQPDGREMGRLVVSSRDLATVRDQTLHVETSVADSVDSTAPPVVRALVQLSDTLIMLAGAGEMGSARLVHEVIGKLLARRSAVGGARASPPAALDGSIEPAF